MVRDDEIFPQHGVEDGGTRAPPPAVRMLLPSQILTTHVVVVDRTQQHQPQDHSSETDPSVPTATSTTNTAPHGTRPSTRPTRPVADLVADPNPHHQQHQGEALRRKAFLDSIIAAQWRLVPLDIIAQPPIAQNVIPHESHSGDAATDAQQQAHSPWSLLGSNGIVARTRLWWRRSVVEPLIHTDDTSFDVWRKAVFAVVWTVCSSGIAVLFVAGLVALLLDASNRDGTFNMEEGYVTFLGASLALNTALYGVVRRTKWLTERLFLGVHVYTVLGCYALCSLHGPRYASISVMMNSLFLMVWIMAVESTSVKWGGVAATYVVTVLALLQAPEMMNFPKATHDDVGGSNHNEHGVIYSRTFLPIMTIFQSMQCLMCTSAFALMLFERHTSQAARAASHAIKEITRALLVDDYGTVMELLTDFRNRGGADAVGGSSGAMLSLRFEAVAECMRTIRPYIPDHAFVQFDRQMAADMASANPQPTAPTSIGRPAARSASVAPAASADRQRRSTAQPQPAGRSLDGNALPTTFKTDAPTDEREGDAPDDDASEVSAGNQLSSSTVTLVLLKYRGRFIAANTALLGSALQRIKEGCGIVEFVGYNHLLASFFGDDPEQAALTLRAVVELRALFWNAAAPHRPHATVSAHQGYGWVGLVKAPTRRWRFVGGVVVEALWRMPSVAQHTLACCIATERVVAPRHEWCCPIDVVAIDPEQREAVAEVIYEVHGYDGGTAATMGLNGDCALNRMFLETGIHPAVPSFEANRVAMFNVVERLSKGRLRSAAEHMRRHIRNPSRQLQRLASGIEAALSSGRAIYFKQWLGWGTVGTPGCLHRLSSDESVTEHSTYSQMEDSQTSLAAAVASTVAMARQDSISVYDRVAENLSERRRKIETTQKEEALFEMFVTPDSGEEIPSYITDNAGRRWRRGMRTYGRGAFGWVFAATGMYGDIVAVKCVDLESRAISATAEEVSQEIHTLSELRHENIVGYIGHGLHAQYYFIIMESVPGGSLSDLLTKFKTLPVAAVARYVRDALEGLKYLHKHEVVHCDIKPPNILITGRGRCKLSDFGSAVNLSHVRAARKRETSEDSHGHWRPPIDGPAPPSSTKARPAVAPVCEPFPAMELPRAQLLSSLQAGGTVSRDTPSESRESGVCPELDAPCEPLVAGHLYHADAVIPTATPSSTTLPPSRSTSVSDGNAGDGLVARGTPHYMAPEACRNDGGMASDVWSLGITTYELLLGHMPWKKPFGSQQDAMFIRQLGNHANPLSEIEWSSLDTLVATSSSSQGALAEAFVRACLVVDAQRRPSVDDLLKHPFFLEPA